MGEMTSAHYKNREMEMITPRLISDVRYSFAPNNLPSQLRFLR
jgi:hypothetical protein